jgi:hypothetical protein
MSLGYSGFVRLTTEDGVGGFRAAYLKLQMRFTVCGRPYREVTFADDPVFYSALGGIHSSGPFPIRLNN